MIEHFTLMPDEMVLVVEKSSTGKLGFALMLKLFQRDGRFLRDFTVVSQVISLF